MLSFIHVWEMVTLKHNFLSAFGRFVNRVENLIIFESDGGTDTLHSSIVSYVPVLIWETSALIRISLSPIWGISHSTSAI